MQIVHLAENKEQQPKKASKADLRTLGALNWAIKRRAKDRKRARAILSEELKAAGLM